MDKLDSMRVLTRVIERKSFSAAATDLSLPRSTVTDAVKQLEKRLGVSLLHRTTRHVTTTLDGEAYYERCLSILAEVEDAEGSFSDAPPRGQLRIDVHGFMARRILLPHLAEFLGRFPDISLHVGEGDRLADLVREGVDCVIRAGELSNSGMIVRRLGLLEEVTVASPSYVERYGMPATPDDLDGHEMVGFVSSNTSQVMPLEFTVGEALRTVTLPSRITVNGSCTLAELARLGFGIVQAPRYRFADDLAAGALVELLPNFAPSPLPVSALYPPSRHRSTRVRVLLDWIAAIFADRKG